MSTLRLLFFFALVAGCCPASGADQPLVGALRWYYRWMAELPARGRSTNCKVAVFTKSEFAYCEPAKLAIDIDTPLVSAASVTNITDAFFGFSVAISQVTALFGAPYSNGTSGVVFIQYPLP